MQDQLKHSPCATPAHVIGSSAQWQGLWSQTCGVRQEKGEETWGSIHQAVSGADNMCSLGTYPQSWQYPAGRDLGVLEQMLVQWNGQNLGHTLWSTLAKAEDVRGAGKVWSEKNLCNPNQTLSVWWGSQQVAHLNASHCWASPKKSCRVDWTWGDQMCLQSSDQLGYSDPNLVKHFSKS